MKQLTAPDRSGELLPRGQVLSITGNALIQWIASNGIVQGPLPVAGTASLGPFAKDQQLIISAVSGAVLYEFGRPDDAVALNASAAPATPAPAATVSTGLALSEQLRLLTYPPAGQWDIASGVLTLDADTADRFRVTVSEAVTSIVLYGVPGGIGEAWRASVEFVQDATGHSVSGWPAEVVWHGGAAPTIASTAGAVTCIVLSAFDGDGVIVGRPGG